MIRKAFFWSHLIVGIVAGVGFLFLCVTGALIAFEEQTIDWMESSALALPPAGVTERLPADELVARVAKAEPSRPASLHYANNPRSPVRIGFANGNSVCVNGYTGAVLGPGAKSLRAFYRFITRAHKELALPGETAERGNAIIAAFNLACVFIILTGIYLWWPRNWRWRALRNFIAIRFDVRGKQRDWNWHNAFGFWSLIPLLIMAGTGVVLSYEGVNQGMINLANKYGPVQAALQTPVAPVTTMQKPVWIRILAGVEQNVPGWRSMIIGWPKEKQSQTTIRVCGGTEGEALKHVLVTVDLSTGAITRLQKWQNRESGVRARAIARLAHTGGFGGLPGQMLAFLGCVAGVILVYTGFALSWRRFFGRRSSASSLTI